MLYWFTARALEWAREVSLRGVVTLSYSTEVGYPFDDPRASSTCLASSSRTSSESSVELYPIGFSIGLLEASLPHNSYTK